VLLGLAAIDPQGEPASLRPDEEPPGFGSEGGQASAP
jgi:hypothetical protein